MAERVVVDRRRCAPLPAPADAAAIAAAMNPAMSSWLALRLRAPIRAGQSVFVLGATGNAGQMAVQIARLPRGPAASSARKTGGELLLRRRAPTR